MTNLNEQGIKAAKRYLDLKGYEVEGIHEGYVVAWDMNCLVFAAVETSMEMPPMQECSLKERERFERAIASYVKECGRTDFAVRLDKCELEVVGCSNALLRHTVNYCG